MNKNKFHYVYHLLVIIFCIISVVLVCYDWIEIYYQTQLIAKPITRAFLFAIFLIVIIDPYTWKNGKLHFLAFPLIAICYLFVSYALFEDEILSGLYYSSRIIFWIVGTFFIYRMLNMGILTENHIKKIIYSVTFIYGVNIFYYLLNPTIEYSQNVSIQVVLWCLPLLIILSKNSNNFINKLFICIAYLVVFMSFKRGAMLALFISTIAYVGITFFIQRSFTQFLKSVSFIFSLVLILVLSIAVVYEFRPDFVENRFADIIDPNKPIGSGRGDFYPYLIKSYASSFHSSTKVFFLGHGSRSVENTLSSGIYAHSDWLQFLYDYGLLGVLVLLWMHLCIIILIIRGINEKFIYVPALVMNYTIFSLFNIYSGMLFFPNSIYFGMFISLYYYLWLNRHHDSLDFNQRKFSL